MKFTKYALAALVGFAAIGCGNKPKPDVAPPKGNGTTETAQQPLEVPESLKGEGFAYMGLANLDLMTYVTEFGPSGPGEGTQQYELSSVEDGKATYEFKRSGALTLLGRDTRVLSSDGIETVNSSMGVLKSESLEMPADVHVGSTWEADITMEDLSNGTKSIVSHAVNKAVKVETIEVPAGSFECLRIESTIDATVEGSPVPSKNGKSVTKFVSWYSKDVGLIKLTGNTKEASGTETNIKLELKSRTA